MDLRPSLLIALAAIACTSPEQDRARAALTSCSCPCPVDDAGPGPDAPDVADASLPDAAPPARDYTLPWLRTVISAGSATAPFRGADGVSVDSEGCWSTAWEEGNAVSRACLVGGAWQTELVATGVSAVEDARAADLDGDGVLDVLSCGADRCQITFRAGPAGAKVTVVLPTSQGHGNVVQAAIADVTSDGLVDLVIGSRANVAARVALLRNPGPMLARTGAAWFDTTISPAGWAMSVIVRDNNDDGRPDVIISDRAKIGTSWALYGARWSEQLADGTWANHTIAGGVCPVALVNGVCPDPTVSAPAGSCPAMPAACGKTPGDEMFLSLGADGNTVYDCTSSAAAVDSRVVIHRTTDWLTWTHETLPAAENVGHCQAVIEVPGGVAITTWKGNALPLSPTAAMLSGVYGMQLTAAGWARVEVSGAGGGKFDNLATLGDCLITSEQLDPAGGLGVVMYCPPWM